MPRPRPFGHYSELETLQDEIMDLQATQMKVLDGFRLINARINTAMMRLKNKRPRNTEVA